jgi:hypothetical protein
MFSSLSLLQIFLEDFGRLFGNTLNNLAVDTIVNGEQADLSEAATVIGVENTTNGITWLDLTRVAIRLGLVGQVGTQIIANETTGLNFLNLTEVKNRFLGTPLLNTRSNAADDAGGSLRLGTRRGEQGRHPGSPRRASFS